MLANLAGVAFHEKTIPMTLSFRPSQRDVARKAHVCQATVSLALKNCPSVALSTRERVQRIAREMNYQPDPYLGGLCAYQKHNTPICKPILAWLTPWATPPVPGTKSITTLYFEGANARALELGYELKAYHLLTSGMTPVQMEEFLRARNINGLLLPPQPKPDTKLDINFNQFSVVTFGYTLAAPQFHTVALNHYQTMEGLLRKLFSLGYERPGLALSVPDDMRTDFLWSAAFVRKQSKLPPRRCVPLLSSQDMNPARFLKWYRRHQPDVVVSAQKELYHWLSDAGISVPQETGFAYLSAGMQDSFYSGIWQNLQLTGAKAVDFLIDRIHCGDRGVPEVRIHLLVNGTWIDGETVRR